MFAVEVIEHEMLQKIPNFTERMDWILKNKTRTSQIGFALGCRRKRQKTSHEYFEKDEINQNSE